MEKQKVSIFWFRRDLRLEDNHGLYEALRGPYPVIPIFIFDTNIIDELELNDARITFIHDQLNSLASAIEEKNGGLYCTKGTPYSAWQEIVQLFDVQHVFANEDYEPYAINRDQEIKKLLLASGIHFSLYKDQVIFEKSEVVKGDQKPYTVYTPYKNKWLSQFENNTIQHYNSEGIYNFDNVKSSLPDLSEIGFTRSSMQAPSYDIEHLNDYEKVRNIPSLDQTSHISTYLRFGTVSIRRIIQKARTNPCFLNELIWREFFMEILYHFPEVVHSNFKRKYDLIEWRNNEDDFEKWKKGETGFPMVDAGMRELNATGFMHNRVRMVVAGFLCKHLLIDWRWGEAYFAEKLFDYELSSNNGNWQWAAGTGCDAAPYFRVFNPTEQIKKFDPEHKYINKWVPELNSFGYPRPMVDHKLARERAIHVYKAGIDLYEKS